MTANPRVFDHVTIRVSDRGASRRFYDTVLAPLGRVITNEDAQFEEWNDFGIAAVSAEHQLTRHLHVAFVARSRDEVDAFWSDGVEAGYRSDGEPGPRPVYHENYYGGFLLDPDGNSAEAVHYANKPRGDGTVDQLWIRVGDVEASKRFYELVAPFGRFELDHDSPERAQFVAGKASFSVMAGSPTQNVHIAFPANANETVDEFHAALTEAGYRDDGPPGERPIYHPGYYGAYVLDPDGHSVEIVNHNR